MKIWEITLLLYISTLLLTALVSLNNSEGLGFQISSTLSGGEGTGEEDILSLKQNLSERVETESGTNILENTALSIWKSVKIIWIAVGLLISAFINATVNSGPFINILMGGLLPLGFQILISTITTLVFVIGIVQFIAGRSMKEMD